MVRESMVSKDGGEEAKEVGPDGGGGGVYVCGQRSKRN